ncbi:unnamed protein product [Adineta ricciae]|uniref:Uncharacterized protein n=1 Tax=Adineta ricciae TaxID=249248 RepID=A0A815I5X4_ADIRI|nr:unnamed protein product [Adineta ricciae]
MATGNSNHISSMHPTGTEYKNTQFQFSVVLPKDWHSKGLVDMFEQLERETYPFTPQSHKSLEERYQEGLEEVLPLFTFSKNNSDATDEKLVPTIQAMAYNKLQISESLTDCDFLQLIQKGIEASHTNGISKLTNNCESFWLNGIHYASQMSHMKTNKIGPIIKQQRFAAHVLKTHVLYMVLNYFDEDQRLQLLDIVNSLKFTGNR